MQIIKQWQSVLKSIKEAVKGGRVKLLAVSKGQSVENILPLLEAGQRVFGENYVQEAAGKWSNLRPRFPDLKLHLIGPLQTNKVKQALQLFDVIESLDRPSLAEKIRQELDKGEYPRFKLFVQVNMGNELQKAGVHLAEADGFIRWSIDELRLPVIGLMTIPPVEGDSIPYFQCLAKLAQKHRLKELSMGMSGDYLQAIACGATQVRVGSLIFGKRWG